MGRFKLIAADLDGTLLDGTYTVKPELMACITRARNLGVDLVVATGRLYPSALPFVKDLEVKLPVIASNGAIVRNPVSGEMIHELSLDMTLALEVLRLTNNCPVQRFVNVGDNFYTDAPEEKTKQYSEALKVNFVSKIPLEEVVVGDPTMVVVRGPEEEIARLTVILRNHFGERVYLANSKPFFIDINHPDVSKGAGLNDLCRRMGIDLGEVIAIGDGWNDREMLEAAGIGACVANAPEGLKQHADYVCVNPSYRGVVEVIEKFILSEELHI